MKAAARADMDYAIIQEAKLYCEPGQATEHWRRQTHLHRARTLAIEDLIGRISAF